jgi:hypothetical protein
MTLESPTHAVADDLLPPAHRVHAATDGMSDTLRAAILAQCSQLRHTLRDDSVWQTEVGGSDLAEKPFLLHNFRWTHSCGFYPTSMGVITSKRLCINVNCVGRPFSVRSTFGGHCSSPSCTRTWRNKSVYCDTEYLCIV